MKIPRTDLNRNGFTLVELLLVIIVIAVFYVVMIGFPEPSAKQKALAIRCMSNQRQIALAFIMWKDDHDGKFPWQVPETTHGTMESSEKGVVAPNYSALLAYVHQPRTFVCPTDPARTVATNQANVLDQNASYFIGLDAGTNEAAVILTGDRHLKAGGVPVQPGLFVYSNGLAMDWTRELHDKIRYAPLGVMSFQDGHAMAVHGTNTDFTFQNEGLATSRFAIP